MQLLFVHGMGRSSLSGWPLLRILQRKGFETHTFGYSTALEDFPSITRRLTRRIEALSRLGDYVLVGHSLGGVLLRNALNGLADDVRLPDHLFLLGSPITAARLATRLERNPVYRVLAGDCGALLASADRMAAVQPVRVPTTAIVGERGIGWKRGPFQGEPNDGVVSVSEVTAPWFAEQLTLPLVHTLLPSSAQVAEAIAERVRLRSD